MDFHPAHCEAATQELRDHLADLLGSEGRVFYHVPGFQRIRISLGDGAIRLDPMIRKSSE